MSLRIGIACDQTYSAVDAPVSTHTQVEDPSEHVPQVFVRMGNGGTPELDPFSHKVVATLEHRGVPYNLIPIDLRNKPEWVYYINRAAK